MKQGFQIFITCVSFFLIVSQANSKVCSTEQMVREGLRTIYHFHYAIFSRDTLNIITAFMPLYLSTRMIDERVQSYFYCPRHHKNIHQMPDFCFKSTDIGLRIILISLASLVVLPLDEPLHSTTYVFAFTLPFTWLGKKFLKVLHTDAWLRPRNEYFDRHKKFFGGCPSGHMMEAVYAAVFFGMECGPAFGVPLGFFAAFLFGNFISCNRHFVSQLVAGAGLGMIYAYAAHKTVHLKRSHNWHFDVATDYEGKPCLQMSYEF
ncbi:MAG: phosphatase PAP2 family protein [Candidatus Babeliaceae bacterium]